MPSAYSFSVAWRSPPLVAATGPYASSGARTDSCSSGVLPAVGGRATALAMVEKVFQRMRGCLAFIRASSGLLEQWR